MRIGIVCLRFEEAKRIFKEIAGLFASDNKNVKISRSPDEYRIETPFFSVIALPLTDKICGYRFNHIITDVTEEHKSAEDMIRPLISNKAAPITFLSCPPKN